MKILFTGGGTAGHVFPILSIVRELKKIYPGKDLEMFYLGPKDSYVHSLIKEGVKVKTILSGKVRRYISIKNLFDVFKLPIGCIQAFFWIFFKNPDIVFSKGGFGSVPVVLSALILHTPVFLHESDSAPGLASRTTAHWAVEIFTSFPKTEKFKKEKIICVGNPIKKTLLNGQIDQAKKIFNLINDKPLVLILGGSQGAMAINEAIVEVLADILEKFELIHQTGKSHIQQIKKESDILLKDSLKPYYHPIAFLQENELRHALKACKLVISRAGSGALFEIAAAAKPSIIVPLPGSAQNHQVKNAYQFSEISGAEVLEQQNLKPHFFLEKIKRLFDQPKVLADKNQRVVLFARPKSAWIIANYLVEYLKQSKKENGS